MAYELTEEPAKRMDAIVRRQVQLETDIKRLWRRVQQLEQALIASGQPVPVPPE